MLIKSAVVVLTFFFFGTMQNIKQRESILRLILENENVSVDT